MRRLAYRDEGGLGAVDEATERARAEELLRVGRGSEGEREDAQHGEEHRRAPARDALVRALVKRHQPRPQDPPSLLTHNHLQVHNHESAQ